MTSDFEMDWEPCLADAHRGIAFFDGVRIEADRITNPRWARVLPILEEEQVRVCRAIRQRASFGHGQRVLDVGTGSGVFAIWAAIHGCEATALDVSPRAIRLAGYNVEFNEALIAKGGGRVRTVLQDVSAFAKEPDNAANFDVVVLSPPYNPTAPGLDPARHAFGGKDGMQLFREQMDLAVHLVRPEGKIVGNQMALHVRDGADAWWREELGRVEQQLGGDRLVVTYAPMLDKPTWPADDFLMGQYKHYLDRRLQLNPGVDEVRRYIDELLEPRDTEKVFGLYYYEIVRVRARDVASRSTLCSSFTLPPLPGKTWDDRISLHQLIVDHTASQNTFQMPTLFLDNAFSLPFPGDATATSTDTNPGFQEREGPADDSPLRTLSKWIAQAELFSGSNAFDFLIIDAAPWYSSWEGRRALHNDVHLYVNEKYAKEKSLDLVEFMTDYQEVVAKIQRLGQGPFLHPLFTGQQYSELTDQSCNQDWGLVYYRVIDGDSHLPGALDSLERHAWETLDRAWQAERATSLPGTSTIDELIAWDDFRVCKAAANLDQLDSDPESIKGRILKLKHSCTEAGLNCDDAKLLKTDLNLLYMAYHQRLRQRFKINDESTKTVLVGLPLRLSALGAASRNSDLPDSFRGGVFVFAGTRNKITTQDESRILDLVRLAVLLESAEIDMKALGALRETVERSYHSDFAHEIKTVIKGLRPDMDLNLLKEIRAYFLMLALYPEDFKRHDARRIWIDVKHAFPDGFAKGNTLKEFVYNHFSIAWRLESMLINRSSRVKNVPSKPSLLWSQIDQRELSEQFKTINAKIPPEKLLELCSFGAALVAAFRNLLSHQHATLREISLSYDGTYLEIVNFVATDEENQGLEEDLPDRKWSTGGVLLQLISRYRRGGKIKFHADPRDRSRWITGLPIPEGFLSDETLSD